MVMTFMLTLILPRAPVCWQVKRLASAARNCRVACCAATCLPQHGPTSLTRAFARATLEHMDTNYSSQTTHVGSVRCQSRFTSSGAAFATDVDASLGGLGIYPSPAQMLACSVASCMLSMIAYTGAQKEFETEGISIRAGYESTPKGITALVFAVDVPMATSPTVRRFMEAAVKSCPVGNAIAPGVEKRITWNWAE